MDTKPFSLQAPESIAKEYGGNKQKIAQAATMGLVDPTAAVLAGMFIDRMRSAQMSEQGPPQTVAQQVFQPQPPAIQPMPSAPQGAPQMPAAPMQQPQQPMQNPMGMAEGGLAALPVPDDMFEETDDYAAGGIVAFAEGGTPTTAPAQNMFYGINVSDPLANAALWDRARGPVNDQYTREMEQEYIRERSPEQRKRRRKEDMWAALAQMGFNMAASKAPTLLQAAGEAGSAALPGLMESARERKAEERELRRGLLDIERGRNTEAAARTQGILSLFNQGTSLAEASAGRDLQERLQREKIAADIQMQREQIAAQRQIAAMRASSGGGGGGGGRSPNFSDFEGRVQARYLRLKRENDRLPYWRPGMREGYRRSDEHLLDQAMTDVGMEMRQSTGGQPESTPGFGSTDSGAGWDVRPVGGS